MQLYKLISLSAAGCSVRKAESQLPDQCLVRHQMSSLLCKDPQVWREVRGGLCLACEAAVAPLGWKILYFLDIQIPNSHFHVDLKLPGAAPAGWNNKMWLLAPSQACSCVWGCAELCDETRSCSNRGKNIGKLNIHTENGIFLWFSRSLFCSGKLWSWVGFFCFSVTVWFFFYHLSFALLWEQKTEKYF